MRARPLTVTLRVLLGALLVVAAWTGVVLVLVKGDLEQARRSLETARAANGAAEALAPLTDAERRLTRAGGRLSQPGPRLAAVVPVLGRSVEVVRRTTAATLAVTRGGREIAAVVERGAPLLVDGRVDLGRLAEIRVAVTAAARDSRGPVQALTQQSLTLVPGPVDRPARQARDRLAGLPEDLAQAAAGLAALDDVLGGQGPRRVLVCLENNAELRATGGVVTVFAEAVARDGRLEVGAFRDVEDVADTAATTRPVPAPASFVALYSRYKANTTLWKNTNMSPDVPTSSAVLAQVAAATTGHPPDVVLWLDVPAIAAVLSATGPATLPDGDLLRADDVVVRLLSTAYRDAPDTAAGQAQRRAQLRGAADAVLGKLLGDRSEQPSAAALARELGDAARGRHLALWSARPEVQQELVNAGLAGEVTSGGGDLAALTVHNLGGGDRDGNKLDFYARRQLSVRVRLSRDTAVVEQELAIRNTAPVGGLPVYVAGRATPGVSNMLVTMALPRQAELISFARNARERPPLRSPEGDHDVVQDVVAVPPGATVGWLLRYRLPLQNGQYRSRLYPQPLAVDAGLLLELAPDGDLELAAPAGSPLQPAGTGLRLSGPFAAVVSASAAAEAPGWHERWRAAVRRFWNEPVELP